MHVSRICLGCMGFGDATHGQHSWTLDEEASRGVIRLVLKMGVNPLGTAIVYQNGTSEQYLGRTLKDFAAGNTWWQPQSFPCAARWKSTRASAGRSTCAGCWTGAFKTWAWIMWPVHLSYVGLPHATGRDHGRPEQRRQSGQGALYRHLELLCLAALQGQRAAPAGGILVLCVRAGAL